MKLSALNQATAYQGIRNIKTVKDPPIATKQLNQISTAIEKYSEECETNETIWTSLRRLVIRTHVQQFLYKTIHQAHMVSLV